MEQARYRVQDLDSSDAAYRAFKTSSNKEVNYLVKEFEMKKAADGYARATTSRTVFLILLIFTHTNTMMIYSRRSQQS